MAQWLKVLTALAEELDSIPSIHVVAFQSSSGDLAPSSGFCRHHSGMWYTYINADKIVIHIKIEINLLKNK